MANDERERVVEAARKFFREVVLPIKCVGYPKCDGDLPGEPHIEECPLHRKNIPKPVETMADFALAHSTELQREIEWWKTHAVVILDKEGEPRCQLKGDSLCPSIEANNRQLKTENAELQRRLDLLQIEVNCKETFGTMEEAKAERYRLALERAHEQFISIGNLPLDSLRIRLLAGLAIGEIEQALSGEVKP